jgi:hypothetical protein
LRATRTIEIVGKVKGLRKHEVKYAETYLPGMEI